MLNPSRFVPNVVSNANSLETSRLRMPRPQNSDDLLRSPEPICAVWLSVDNSGSMLTSGAGIQQQRALDEFGHRSRNDRMLAGGMCVGMSGYGKTSPSELLLPLTPSPNFYPPQFATDTASPLYSRMMFEVEFLAKVMSALAAEFDRDVRPTMLVATSDGLATDPQNRAGGIHAARVLATEAGIELYLIGVGENCNMAALQQLAQPGRDAIHLRDLKDGFSQLFRWVHRSVSCKYRSCPGDQLRLPHPFDPRLPDLRAEA